MEGTLGSEGYYATAEIITMYVIELEFGIDKVE